MLMDKNQNDNTPPTQMNIYATMLASILAKDATKEDVLDLIQFLAVLSSALKSYL